MALVFVAALAFSALFGMAKADPAPHPESVVILQGVDGSRVRVTLRSAPDTEPHAQACLRNNLLTGPNVGLSYGRESARAVAPGKMRCFDLAPAHQVFVLWILSGIQAPKRSMSYPVDLTNWSGHVVLFEWIGGT